jgi:hypothetical protein
MDPAEARGEIIPPPPFVQFLSANKYTYVKVMTGENKKSDN